MSSYDDSIRYFEVEQLNNLINKDDETISKNITDGKIKTIDKNGKKYFDIKDIKVEPCINEISFALLGETRVGKTVLKDSILDPLSRDSDKEITTNEGDTKITRNYIVKKNSTEYWKINKCKFNIGEIQKNIILNFKRKQKDNIIKEYKDNKEKTNIYMEYAAAQYDKDIELDNNELKIKIDKINKEDLSNDCLENNIYPQVLHQIKEIIKTNIFLDFKKYEGIINECDLNYSILDKVELDKKERPYNKVLKELCIELDNDIKKLSKIEFENYDSVNLAKLVKAIDIDVRMNEYIATRTGLETINITDTRGIGDSEDILTRGIFINSFDAILILMTPNEGSSTKIKETIEKMNIVSSNIECVVIDKNFEKKLDDSTKNKKIQTAKKNYDIIKRIVMDLKLLPKNIIEYEDSEILSIAMNFDFGSLIPRYNKAFNNEEEEEFYQDHVVKLLNKIAYSKYLSFHVLDNIINKLCRKEIQPIYYLGDSFKGKVWEMAQSLNQGRDSGLIMCPKAKAFRKNMFKVFKLDLNESNWSFQYSGHYLTESGAVVLKKHISNLIYSECDNLNSNLSRTEELIFIREVYKYLMKLESYPMYIFGNYFNYEVRERLSKDSYKESLINEKDKIDISMFTDISDFSEQTNNILENMINYSIKEFIKILN